MVYETDLKQPAAELEKDYPSVAASFHKKFSAVSQTLWLKEGHYLFAYFLQDTKKVTAVFSLNGRLKYAISILGIHEVPESIRHKIKLSYPSLQFFLAKEIFAGGYTAYELIYKDHHEFIHFTTTDYEGELVITGRLTQQ